MAKEVGIPKYDPNTEAFQMRAQWKKADNCKKLWMDRWSWLLEERKQTLAESDFIRQQAAGSLQPVTNKLESSKTLKPVPLTSNGVIGWLARRRDCQLEVYTSWLTKIPVKLPDTWDNKDYIRSEK